MVNGREAQNGKVIVINELVKKFDDVTAVNGLNLEVRKGEMFGFLGPNGAGKTTTISMLCGLLKPSAGTAHVGGFDIAKEPQKAKSKPKSGKKSSAASRKGKVASDLASSIEQFRQKYGSEVFRTYESEPVFPHIPTGSIIIDKIIGIGGIPRGRLTEFFGWESTGKTTLALQVMGVARKSEQATTRTAWIRQTQLYLPVRVTLISADCVIVLHLSRKPVSIRAGASTTTYTQLSLQLSVNECVPVRL